tara:strand:+ start:387 stop:713 length:327 start_codon:yes stop_codon:yes gene_type:complete
MRTKQGINDLIKGIIIEKTNKPIDINNLPKIADRIIEALIEENNLIIPNVMHWVAIEDYLPSDDAQVLVEWNNGRFGVNEYWESDECWKYQFDKINVVRWQEIKPLCA